MTETECPACRLRAQAKAQAEAWIATHPDHPRTTATCLEHLLQILHDHVPRAPGYLALRQLCEQIETTFPQQKERAK